MLLGSGNLGLQLTHLSHQIVGDPLLHVDCFGEGFLIDRVARLVDLCEVWLRKRRSCRVEITLVLVDSGVKSVELA